MNIEQIEQLKTKLKDLKVKIIKHEELEFDYQSCASLDRDYRLVDVQIHPSFLHIPEHKQDFIEIMYVYSGEITYLIGEKPLHLHTGDMLVLTPHLKHQIVPEDEHAIGLYFRVLPEFFDIIIKLLKNRVYLSDYVLYMLKRSSLPQSLLFSLKGEKKIENIMENIVYSVIEPKNEDPAILQTSLSLVFLELLNTRENLCLYGEFNYPELVVQASLRFLEDHYNSTNLLELSEMIGIEEMQLGKIIEDKLGVTFWEILTHKRFLKAVFMLVETELTVEEIAETTGYENISFFYRQFKRRYNMTPYQFRKKSRSMDFIRI